MAKALNPYSQPNPFRPEGVAVPAEKFRNPRVLVRLETDGALGLPTGKRGDFWLLEAGDVARYVGSRDSFTAVRDPRLVPDAELEAAVALLGRAWAEQELAQQHLGTVWGGENASVPRPRAEVLAEELAAARKAGRVYRTNS